MLEIEAGGEALALLPEKAAWWPAQRALLVADAHVGKAQSFRRLGVPVPRGTTTETLAALSEAELARVPLDDDLREEVRRTRAVTSHIARKRQNQFLAKQLRKLDEEAIEAIRYALSVDREKAHRETAAMHRIEIWRGRLLEEGDEALAELLHAVERAPSVTVAGCKQLDWNARRRRFSGCCDRCARGERRACRHRHWP